MKKVKKTLQLSSLLNSYQPDAVFKEVKRIFRYHYPAAAFQPVKLVYPFIKKLFAGKWKGYRKCNTEYHNLGHTMDALLASARLLDGYNLMNAKAPAALAANLLVAALVHDTGYIQESWDTIGTGAKYTKGHVERSVVFLNNNRKEMRLAPADASLIGNIIRCTGLQISWTDISFDNTVEKAVGTMLGTADLLGQMSDRAYLEKLLFLYYEFREADVPGYNTEYDIIRNTVSFYEITRDRLDTVLMGVYNYAQSHFKARYNIDWDLYMEAISRQIEYLKRIIADGSTNFRQKLKRTKELKKNAVDKGQRLAALAGLQ
jgi:hypothetical protein